MKRLLYFLVLWFAAGQPVWAQTEEPIQLKTADLTLDGTLSMPAKSTSPVPVVLLIAGSGPTDRNGNNPIPSGQKGSVKANSYRMLADSLTKYGIAVVRYDKRLIGRSVVMGMNEKNLTFESYINDAEGWVNQLKADKRFDKVVVAGHSEGSLIGMVAARRAKADAYISIAGSGDDINSKLKTQLKTQFPGVDQEAIYKALDSLRAGFTLGASPTSEPMLKPLFRPSIQPYLISWMKYDPAAQLKLLTIPVLIVQGKRDVQVAVSDGERLHNALPGAQYRLFDEMNHGLKNVPTDSMEDAQASYNDPNQPLTPGLAALLAGFVKSK